MKLQFIRIDKENTHNMAISFMLWPYNAESLSDDTFRFITSFCEFEYEAAASLAMKLLKDPANYLQTCDYVENKDLLAKELEDVDGYEIYECLNIFDKNWVAIDCPEEYIFDVGTIFKEDEPSSAEQWS